jgi:transcriptional regulator with XRE-family HTH domain
MMNQRITHFGHFLAAARKRKGLDQAELGRLVGVKQQTVSRWEAGSRPRVREFAKLASALGESEKTLKEKAGYGAPAEMLPALATISHDQPFPVDALSAESFQRFVEDLVRALHPDAKEVRAAGKTGHDQGGTDLLAVLSDGRRLSFQCERVTRFGPTDVKSVADAHVIPADHKYLVISRVASPQTASTLRALSGWTLWDKDDIARLIRDLAPIAQRRLVDKYFPGQRYALLGDPAPGPWQTLEEFFAPFAGTQATFSHDWALVGREGKAAEIVRALHDETKRIVLLLGPGGSANPAS